MKPETILLLVIFAGDSNFDCRMDLFNWRRVTTCHPQVLLSHFSLTQSPPGAMLREWLTLASTSAILRLGSGRAARSCAEQHTQHSGDRERCRDTQTRRGRRLCLPWIAALPREITRTRVDCDQDARMPKPQ